MKEMVFTKTALVSGDNALLYLKKINYKCAVIVTGGQSMVRTGVIDRITKIMKPNGSELYVYSGISKNPTTSQVDDGAIFMKEKNPDIVLAVGGGSAIDAAKVMILFYEHPELSFENIFTESIADIKLNTKFIAVPSTSGTASEVTQVSVITLEEQQFKMAIKTGSNKTRCCNFGRRASEDTSSSYSGRNRNGCINTCAGIIY